MVSYCHVIKSWRKNHHLLSPRNGKLSIIELELSSKRNADMRYVAGYPNFQAITAYNHSQKYAMTVSEMAEAFKK